MPPTIILLDEIGVALQRYHELENTFWEGLRSLASSPELEWQPGFRPGRIRSASAGCDAQ